MKAFLFLVLIGVAGYLFYLSPFVRWAEFGPLCLTSHSCVDPIAAVFGVFALMLAIFVAARVTRAEP